MTAISDFSTRGGRGGGAHSELRHMREVTQPLDSSVQAGYASSMYHRFTPPSPSPSHTPSTASSVSPNPTPAFHHQQRREAWSPPSFAPPKPYLPLRNHASETLRSHTLPFRPPSPQHRNENQFRFFLPTVDFRPPTRSAGGVGAPPSHRNHTTPWRQLRDAHFEEPFVKKMPRADGVALPADLPGPAGRLRGQTASQVHAPSKTADWPLKPAMSIPDLRASPSAPRSVSSSLYRPDRRPYTRESSRSSGRREHGHHRQSSTDGLRTSYRSMQTTASSSFGDASATERSSVATKDTSLSDITQPTSLHDDSDDEGMSVEDAISMYATGFSDEPHWTVLPEPPAEFDYRKWDPHPVDDHDPHLSAEPKFLKSRSASHPPDPVPRQRRPSLSEVPGRVAKRYREPEDTTHWAPTPDNPRRSKSLSGLGEMSKVLPERPRSILKTRPEHVPRDRYGFKKATQHVTETEYNAWNKQYEQHLDRRKKKWVALMKQHGLSVDNPHQFPPRSDKIKRYIRKGIPPEWRGAAWFWYTGGPVKIAQKPGLYQRLLKTADEGGLSEHDREQLERDLNRTFPDNIQFRPDTSTSSARPYQPFNHDVDEETPIVGALRRVLTAFAVDNPSIGYCQSLNFLAGLLLIFLNSDEEKAFILLSILCNDYLPGAHGRVLEASVEVGVLMTCVRESMPAIWGKIDDQPQVDPSSPPGGLARLPTVSLATTAWFMSCFVGNLPIESVLRVWDCLFYEGSKTLFRIALTIFKLGEPQIRAVSENLEIFQVVQQIPRNLLDPNVLMEACYRRRNGFGHLSQDMIDAKRRERRAMVKDGAAAALGENRKPNTLRRAASRARLRRASSRRRG